MRERMIGVPISITCYVRNDQPGFVACEFMDSHGRQHHFIEKTAIVTADDIDANTHYPHPGVIACIIIERHLDTSGNEVIVVDTTEPWGVESTDGIARFEVLRSELVEWEWGSSARSQWNGIA